MSRRCRNASHAGPAGANRAPATQGAPDAHRACGAPRRIDDAARVSSLATYRIMDTPPEQPYDDLVLLAASICGTTQAAITFVDEDRQWFKARLGIDVPGSPRADSFCAYTILDTGRVFEVEDALEDQRFTDTLFVTDHGLRFYAGTALVGSDDQPLGALCVIADTPHRLRPDQVAALEALGRQVVGQLELRRELIAAQANAALLLESERRYRVLAHHDPLTGLPNRASFLSRMQELQGVPVGLCFLDLDRFKTVNDLHGHEAGDRALQRVAEVLLTTCGPDALAARLGGDEFVVLCAGVDEPAMRQLAAAVESAVEEQIEVRDGVFVSIGASAGWTVTAGDVPPDEALRRADQAMYDKKAARRRRSDVVVRAGSDGEELRRGMEAGELVLHYQPFFDVCRAGRGLRAHVSGAEALVRWAHPTRGLLGADHIVPLAEQTGLVIDLGTQVLAQAIAQTAEWDRRGLLPQDFQTHVNLAAEQLHTGRVLDTIIGLLASSGLDPRRLCLEVTESGLLHVEDFTVEAAGEITRLGVELALDDFGTGFSSLTQLRSYPFGVVKVDRSFVKGLGSSPEDEAIVESVIALAHRLDIVPIAEGVETLEQLHRLVAMGCARVQGFLLGRPVDFRRWDSAVFPEDTVRLGADPGEQGDPRWRTDSASA